MVVEREVKVEIKEDSDDSIVDLNRCSEKELMFSKTEESTQEEELLT